jgi:hypothetical protein
MGQRARLGMVLRNVLLANRVVDLRQGEVVVLLVLLGHHAAAHVAARLAALLHGRSHFFLSLTSLADQVLLVHRVTILLRGCKGLER